MNLDHPSKDIKCTKGTILKGKTICIGLTGSVAVVNIPALCRELMRLGAEVYTVMTEAASKLIQPELLYWATGNKPITELTGKVEHIAIAGARPGQKGLADLILVAPATANTISKIACGIDDTPVTTLVTTAFGSKTPIIIVPAMHESMYNHPILEKNIQMLQGHNIEFIMPRIQENKAKISEIEEIISVILKKLNTKKDCEDLNFLITAGPGREYVDNVRFISNPSSGKMGMELANEIISRGGKCAVIYGTGGTAEYAYGAEISHADSANDFLTLAKNELSKTKYDVFISAAAIPDYTPIQKMDGKIQSKQEKLVIELKPTPKIIDEIRLVNKKVFIVAFKAEANLNSENLIKKAYNRMMESGINMIIANDIKNNPKTGFGSDFNEVFIIDDKNGVPSVNQVSLSTKREIASHIIDAIISKLNIK